MFYFCRDDGKGDIQCRYASNEEAEKEPGTKPLPPSSGGSKEHINPALAAGDTSDIVEDAETKSSSNNNNNSNNNKNNTKATNSSARINSTAKVEKKNTTVCNNDTKSNNNSCLKTQQNKNKTADNTKKKLNVSENEAQMADSSGGSIYGLLWVCSRMLDWWSYGYNWVWNLLRSGKCPVPWLTSTRLHCNIRK